jgi:hypothetical protein
MILRKKLYIKGMELKQNKTKRVLTLIAPLAIGFSLCACGGSDVAGGGPSGTEAGNAITAQILIANAPAANARVKLVEHNSLNGIEDGYTAIANDSGFITIEKVPVGNYTMEATLNESAVQWPVDIKDTVNEVNLGAHSLQKSVYIGGSVANFFADSISENFKNMTGVLKFRGLDHSATIKDGKFEVKGLPAGTLNMVFIPANATDTVYVPITTDAGDSITTLKPQDSIPENKNETLLIDDFEDGDNLHLYGSNFKSYILDPSGGWTLLATNYGSNAKVNIYPEYNASENSGHPFLVVIQGDENGGNEVNVNFDFPDSADSSFVAIIMLYIGKQYTTYDLSSVDSIAFNAWGQGEAEIQVIDETRKDSTMYYSYTSGKYPFTLPKTKERLKFAWADIVPKAEDRKRVTTISIVFHDDAKLHFDNLEFIGKDLLNIWKQQ